MIKPTVLYIPTKFDYIEINQQALIIPINHPSPLVSNTRYTRTSTVLSHDKDTGKFETINTLYEPVNDTNSEQSCQEKPVQTPPRCCCC